MGEKNEVENFDEGETSATTRDISSAEITFNELGQKVLKYQSHGYEIVAVIKNQPSDEAIKAANSVYMKHFYKFNPQD